MSGYSLPVATLPTAHPADLRPTAVVYCEGFFGRIDGKTANGLVRSSERYRILAVIDSTTSGADAGLVLDGAPVGIPVVASLDDAMVLGAAPPTALIIGLAPLSGLLGDADRGVVLAAIAAGLDIVSGMHEFLGEDVEMAAAAIAYGVTLTDVRKPRDTKHLRMFDGAIASVDCVRIAVLGTDGAIGKRTTATILTRALNEAGIRTVMVSTGQTGLIQGADYGVALDAIPAQFGVGELEGAVVAAWEMESPQVIVVEGQGALSHPAYLSSTVVLRASRPQGVVLQHAPGRLMLSDYPDVPMPTPRSEIALIEAFGRTAVIGMAINHEAMSRDDVAAASVLYEAELGIPVVDALWGDAADLVAMIVDAFPALAAAKPAAAA